MHAALASAVRLKGITKTFGSTTAVDDLHLDVPTGGLYGFIGPNGAGKTTTIRMVMSIFFPDVGELSVLGHETALQAKDRIGYVDTGLDDRIEELLQRNVRDAIIGARLNAEALDRAAINALMQVDRVNPIELGETETRESLRVFDQMLPVVFMGLLFLGVMTGGQGLLTTMVEEKSNRVVEVLLSAVSPFELMTGKLLGQMGVSLIALSLYLFTGLALLLSTALLGLLNLWLLVYLIIFFVIAYLVVGSMMLTIGAAVNEVREAQSLMTPIMLFIMIPWMLWFPIARDPGSAFSTAVSFIPPINTFAMLLRVASSAPPPAWQVWLSIAIGVASIFAALWIAGKVFRIGLLMYGRPPNFATLVRWVRSA